jgi:putative ABC transport system permease protein
VRLPDLLALAAESLRLHRLRTLLTLTGIGIGVLAVVLLTAIGEAAKGYVMKEFAELGSNLVIASPGKSETFGGMPIATGTTRDLTLDDSEAIAHQLPSIRQVAPLAVGSAPVQYGGRTRDVRVVGTTAEFLPLRGLVVEGGRFLASGDPRRGEAVVVLGHTVVREVFGGENPLGRQVRIGRWRFRVIGVLAPKGHAHGIDMDDSAVVPVATAMRMFDQRSLFRIMIEANDGASVPAAVAEVKRLLTDRHDGHEDFTLVTQDATLRTFGAVLNALTAALAGIAAVSLAVAAIGIMNVMLVSVSERTTEVGLLKALGARRRQILAVFLTEAVMLSGLGALAGVAVGVALTLAAATALPEVPLRPGGTWIAAVTVLALVFGAVFGLLPARRAARLDPAQALRGRR